MSYKILAIREEQGPLTDMGGAKNTAEAREMCDKLVNEKGWFAAGAKLAHSQQGSWSYYTCSKGPTAELKARRSSGAGRQETLLPMEGLPEGLI